MKKGVKFIGIDIGSSYSSVGTWRDERVHIIPNEFGLNRTPSIVAYTGDGQILIGEDAKKQ